MTSVMVLPPSSVRDLRLSPRRFNTLPVNEIVFFFFDCEELTDDVRSL